MTSRLTVRMDLDEFLFKPEPGDEVRYNGQTYVIKRAVYIFETTQSASYELALEEVTRPTSTDPDDPGDRDLAPALHRLQDELLSARSLDAANEAFEAELAAERHAHEQTAEALADSIEAHKSAVLAKETAIFERNTDRARCNKLIAEVEHQNEIAVDLEASIQRLTAELGRKNAALVDADMREPSRRIQELTDEVEKLTTERDNALNAGAAAISSRDAAREYNRKLLKTIDMLKRPQADLDLAEAIEGSKTDEHEKPQADLDPADALQAERDKQNEHINLIRAIHEMAKGWSTTRSDRFEPGCKSLSQLQLSLRGSIPILRSKHKLGMNVRNDIAKDIGQVLTLLHNLEDGGEE